jgi:DNA-binding MarR family transcriptional regulator
LPSPKAEQPGSLVVWKKGLAHREQDQEDGRICCVTLTEEGRSLLKRIEDQLTDKVHDVLAPWTRDAENSIDQP